MDNPGTIPFFISTTKRTKVLEIFFLNFVLFVLLCLTIFAACANFSVTMLIVSIPKKSHRGGAEDTE